MVNYYFSRHGPGRRPAGDNPFIDALFILAALVVLGALLVVGFFALLVVGTIALISAAAFALRFWWLSRRVGRRSAPRPAGSGSPRVIEGEFTELDESRERGQ